MTDSFFCLLHVIKCNSMPGGLLRRGQSKNMQLRFWDKGTSAVAKQLISTKSL